MTFDPNFAFYRDDRQLDAHPDENFWPAMKAEIRRLYDDRARTYPDRVAKGRMPRADADREMRVARAMAEDAGAVDRTPDLRATWSDLIHCLRREITLRRQHWPRQVEARRLAAVDGHIRILVLEILHDVLWHTSGLPEARAARAARTHHLDQQQLKRAA